MKTIHMLVLVLGVSFLAICRAETTPPKGQETVPATNNPVNKIEQLKTAIRKDPSQIHLIQQLAEELHKAAENDKASALLWKYIDKIDRRGMILLAKVHEQQKDADQMIKALNIITAKNPKDHEAFYLLGNAYFMKNKVKESMEQYKTATELNTKYEPAYLGLVKIYEKRNNLYELRMIYQDMIDNIGPRPQYLAKICEINTTDGVFEAAITKCQEAIAKTPDEASNYVYMGLSKKGTGDNEAAEKQLKQAANKFPKSEFAQYSYARLLEDNHNFLDALKYYQKAAEADTNSSRAWLGVATCSLELQKYDASLDAFKKACKLDKKIAVNFRRAAAQINRNKQQEDWARKFTSASESCSYGN